MIIKTCSKFSRRSCRDSGDSYVELGDSALQQHQIKMRNKRMEGMMRIKISPIDISGIDPLDSLMLGGWGCFVNDGM